MFVHCLLPALLLFAAVLSAVTDDYPPIVTTETEGSIKHVIRTASETFRIPDGQCYGVLDISKQEKLRCPWGFVVSWVDVKVYDYTRVKITLKNLNNVKVVRYASCVSEAIVSVEVGCRKDPRNELDPPRKVLISA